MFITVPNVKLTHHIVHREALVSKVLQHDLGGILDGVVSILNVIKKQPLQSRLFTELCKEMGAEESSAESSGAVRRGLGLPQE